MLGKERLGWRHQGSSFQNFRPERCGLGRAESKGRAEIARQAGCKVWVRWEYTEYAGVQELSEAIFEVQEVQIKDALLLRDTTIPVHVQPAQWKRLKQYLGIEK